MSLPRGRSHPQLCLVPPWHHSPGLAGTLLAIHSDIVQCPLSQIAWQLGGAGGLLPGWVGWVGWGGDIDWTIKIVQGATFNISMQIIKLWKLSLTAAYLSFWLPNIKRLIMRRTGWLSEFCLQTRTCQMIFWSFPPRNRTTENVGNIKIPEGPMKTFKSVRQSTNHLQNFQTNLKTSQFRILELLRQAINKVPMNILNKRGLSWAKLRFSCASQL